MLAHPQRLILTVWPGDHVRKNLQEIIPIYTDVFIFIFGGFLKSHFEKGLNVVQLAFFVFFFLFYITDKFFSTKWLKKDCFAPCYHILIKPTSLKVSSSLMKS